MTAPRWELKDSHHPEWRGQRFASLARALREHAASVPPGRFYLVDRETGHRVNTASS